MAFYIESASYQIALQLMDEAETYQYYKQLRLNMAH